MTRARRGLAAIPRGVWVLGIVSLCMDLSSELVHALLPLYMATVMGASTFVIGVIEGLAEATALIVKLFSGVLRTFRKRAAVLLGYGLGRRSSCSRWHPRWADRHRGLRTGRQASAAHRARLIADITPPATAGAASLRRSTRWAASAGRSSR
jgi:hypothetical protein